MTHELESCAGKLDTVYKLDYELGVYCIQAGSWKKLDLYTVYIHELEKLDFRYRPEIEFKKFLVDQCSRPGLAKLTAPIFGLRRAAMFGSQSRASEPAASRSSVIAIFRSKFQKTKKNF